MLKTISNFNSSLNKAELSTIQGGDGSLTYTSTITGNTYTSTSTRVGGSGFGDGWTRYDFYVNGVHTHSRREYEA